ncbi:MAG: single-stranded-DNA-specific exonuclease RecJ [Thermodesulfobacteriota bacterium]
MTSPNHSNADLKLSDGTPLDPLLARILANRNIMGQEEVGRFLEPKLQELPDPFLMMDMERAVEIIADTILAGGPILIVGDYDVDGTTGTALLLQFFKGIGVSANFCIPNRLTEGYGLQEAVLERVENCGKNGGKLLITVDNGISAHAAIRLAKEQGYRVVVTDHHTPPEERVAADAVLNPKQEGCGFPDKNLAGVGVAFYLAMGLRAFLNKKSAFFQSRPVPNLKQLLDLVAIGTVADMVPLTGVNRILVRGGMEVMASDFANPGLSALCGQTNTDCTYVRSEDISFQLAPKINAAGRLGQAEKAVALFLAHSKSEARSLAGELVALNERRRNISLDDFVKAKKEVGALAGDPGYATIVADTYHIGVAGIVASNLVEAYGRVSVVLCSQGGGIFKGSARSIPGIDLYAALDKCKELLINYGGHPMAGGLSLKGENIEKFYEQFDLAVGRQSSGREKRESDRVDAEIKVGELFSGSTLRQLHYLEPFGQGNHQPIFRDKVINFKEVSPLGKDKSHLRLSFKHGKTAIKGVAFGLGKQLEECCGRHEKEILYTPGINYFRGKRSWQVRVTKISVIQE